MPIKADAQCSHLELFTLRSGNPLLSVDLARVSVETARSTIVLATADSPDRSDARVLRVVLSLMGVNDRLRTQGLPGLPVRAPQ